MKQLGNIGVSCLVSHGSGQAGLWGDIGVSGQTGQGRDRLVWASSEADD